MLTLRGIARMGNMRLLESIFALTQQDFERMSTKMQNGFWSPCNSILNIVYEGSVSHPIPTISGFDASGGNFDVARETAERIRDPSRIL